MVFPFLNIFFFLSVGGGGLGCFDDIVRVLAFFFEAVVSCFIFSCSFIYHILWLFINFSFLAELRLSTDVSYGSQLYRKRLNYFFGRFVEICFFLFQVHYYYYYYYYYYY